MSRHLASGEVANTSPIAECRESGANLGKAQSSCYTRRSDPDAEIDTTIFVHRLGKVARVNTVRSRVSY